MPDCSNFTVGKVWKVDVLGTDGGGGRTVQTYHLRFDGIVTPHTLERAVTDIGAWVDDLYAIVKLFCSVSQAWDTYRVTGLGEVCVSGDVPIITPVAGEMAGDPMPTGVAALISFQTNIKRVGLRKYFGQLSEAITGPSGNIATANLGLMTDAVDFLMAQYDGPGGNQYTYGYESPKAGGFVTPSGGVARNIPAYQRRRRQGVGQ